MDMDKMLAEQMLEIPYNNILRDLQGGRLFNVPIDITNIKHLVVGAYYIGLMKSSNTQMFGNIPISGGEE